MSRKHNLKTGAQVPVKIVAELDRKIDDGNPFSGGFQFSRFGPAGGEPDEGLCVNLGAGSWNIVDSETNCGGASLF